MHRFPIFPHTPDPGWTRDISMSWFWNGKSFPSPWFVKSFPSPRVPEIFGSLSSCPPSLVLISFISCHTYQRHLDSPQLATPSVPWSLDGAFRLCTSWSHDRPAYSPSSHIRDSIFGMLCIQVWTYYQRYPNDHWSYKVLVRDACVSSDAVRTLTPSVLFVF